jgi:hypothetical protein
MANNDKFYFSHLPDVWVRMGPSEGNKHPYVKVKNIFRNVTLANNLQKEFLLFTPILIEEGDRPETISYQYYGDPAYDWIILLCNNITNVYDQWPLTNNEMWDYIQRHYPDIDVRNEIHHYETNKIQLSNGITVLEEGLIVNDNFTYKNPETQIVMSGLSIRHPVTLYEHLIAENEKKKELYLLKKTYLGQFISEFDKLVEYDDDVETDDGAPLTKSSISEYYIGGRNR